MTNPDSKYKLVSSNHSTILICTAPNKRIVAVKVLVDMFSHEATGKSFMSVSESSKIELLNQNLSYLGMNMKFIPLIN